VTPCSVPKYFDVWGKYTAAIFRAKYTWKMKGVSLTSTSMNCYQTWRYIPEMSTVFYFAATSKCIARNWNAQENLDQKRM